MSNCILNPYKPQNEPILNYAPGSAEKKLLKAELERQKNTRMDIPIIIGGKEIRTGNTAKIECPHDHSLDLGVYHLAGEEEIQLAINSALNARETWAKVCKEDRMAIFMRAAELLSKKYRPLLNAATMLGQSKTAYQAEIDSACELIDFWRFNTGYMQDIYSSQPEINPEGIWNKLHYRPLEGFVFAITPFNFTAIAGNLVGAPALMGNVCVFKPSSSAVLSAYYIMQILKEAGLPDGVINMIPGRGSKIGKVVLNHRDLGGIHFTGSTNVFNSMWKTVGENLSAGIYKSYPRIVGETGGKDFIFSFSDTNKEALATAMVRGAFEYQGQKCSAASRAYLPKSIWPEVKKLLEEKMAQIKIGDVSDFRNFMGAVINRESFDKIVSYIEGAKASGDAEVAIGGKYDDSKGYFIHPTVIEAKTPDYKSMEEEIFGPVLTVYVYEDGKEIETLDLLDQTSPYALTGAVFSDSRENIRIATDMLENAAGNFYINDKPTGAVVGQQPFGGARASGTNDKAGSKLNLLRWVSPRTIKENFCPPTDFTYPHMLEE